MKRQCLGIIASLQLLTLSMGFIDTKVDPNCNYYQKMNLGEQYYAYNPTYPDYYYGQMNCRWISVAPPNYSVKATCDITLPETENCVEDRLLISAQGNSNLLGASTYCGSRNIIVTSQNDTIAIALMAPKYTLGGRFLCKLEAVPKTPPPPSYCNCGWTNSRRIVGGVETLVNEYPMMAGLVDPVQKEIFCGATIINQLYAVTAAHCLHNKQPYKVGLLVGDHDITIGSETLATKLLVISEFRVHEGFNINDPTYKNDIAVVKTASLIEFNFLVGPACLPFRYYSELFTGKSVNILGWGTTDFTGPKSNVLLKTDVNIVAPETCASTNPGTIIKQVCTYKKGHDACQSDSGGPILWQNPSNGRVYLVGIVSYGLGCASSRPSVNTRINSYLDWIMSATNDGEFCVK